MARLIRKKKVKRNIGNGIAHINASFNNTIIMITDMQGNPVAWSSAGSLGLKGSRKSTPYAAQLVGEDAVNKIHDCGIKNLNVLIKGPGTGWESAIRAFRNGNFTVFSVRDVTPLPHNGVRPKKRRRS